MAIGRVNMIYNCMKDRGIAYLIPTEYLGILKWSSGRADCSDGGQRGGLRHGRRLGKRRLKGGTEVALAVITGTLIFDSDDKPVAPSNLSLDAKLDRQRAVTVSISISLIYRLRRDAGQSAGLLAHGLKRGGEYELRIYVPVQSWSAFWAVWLS